MTMQAMRVGLSPRVRGNRRQSGRDLSRYGTIPACTGEPNADTVDTVMDRDYPRVYGGTNVGVWDNTYAVGLSPRVRGNR